MSIIDIEAERLSWLFNLNLEEQGGPGHIIEFMIGGAFLSTAGLKAVLEQAAKDAAEVARLGQELTGMTKNRDNLRIYLAERTKQRDDARDAKDMAEEKAKRARRAAQVLLDSKIDGEKP